MSELGEIFSGLREASKEKRRNNREKSADLLKERGFKFESKNDGAHLIIQSKRGIIDFWPGTGLWRNRCGHKGRGVFNLLTYLRNK